MPKIKIVFCQNNRGTDAKTSQKQLYRVSWLLGPEEDLNKLKNAVFILLNFFIISNFRKSAGSDENCQLKAAVILRKNQKIWHVLEIKPYYCSEGPGQGSCGVSGGVFILSRLLLWGI